MTPTSSAAEPRAAARERRSHGIRVKRRIAVSGHDDGQLGNVGRGPSDLERRLSRAGVRAPERKVPALTGLALVLAGLQRGFVLLRVRLGERSRAVTQGLGLRGDPPAFGPRRRGSGDLCQQRCGKRGDEGRGGTAPRSPSRSRDVIEELLQGPVQQGHAGIVIEVLLGLEANPQLFDDRRVALVALGLERGLEIGDETGTELGIGLGTGDDLVEPGLRERQLLRCPHPRLGRRRQGPDQACEALFVESGHREPDAEPASFLPSRSSRRRARHLEIRLAIVPEGRSRASPIVL